MEEILKNLNYQPARLTKGDLKDPMGLIAYFFVNYPIHETRESIWKLYESWVYDSSEYTNAEMTNDMLLFYNRLIELLEACYVLAEQAKIKATKTKVRD